VGGLVENLARPGRNMTRMSQLWPQFVGKRMVMLELARPQTRLARADEVIE
jgi:hypothetical protein